jgi:hypothetical protein
MKDGDRLLIATDELPRLWFAPIEAHYDVMFAGDLVALGAPSHWSSWWRDCSEQIICAHGISFLGTRLSTYSSYIHRLRGYYGAADKRIRFADQEHDAAEDDGFSWAAARRAGTPMWGREFREGWEV